MKKALISIIVSIIILIAGVFILIPGKLQVKSSVLYAASGQGVFNFLTSESNWENWWPGTLINNENGKKEFQYEGCNYQIEKILYHVYELLVATKNEQVPAFMKIITFATDSTFIEFTTELNAGINPVTRISKYLSAKKIKASFDGIITSLAAHTGLVRNIYGYEIHNEKVQMQHLVSTSKDFNHYPTTSEVYDLINKLRNYIMTTDGKEEFSPMLNIETKDSINFTARVGLPVNKKLPGTKEISAKQMVKNGNILVTEVTGGLKTIENAFKQTEKYITDYQRSIIAIPFQSLETDRLKVEDTTKWVTKIYYPVV